MTGAGLELTPFGHTLFESPLKWVLILAPLGLVMVMSFGINRLSPATALALFLVYAGLLGLSLSTIFLVYTGASITRVFFISAATFGAMSLYGYTTQRDLTGFGSFLFMGLIGTILGFAQGLAMEWYVLHVVLREETGFVFDLLVPWKEALGIGLVSVVTATAAGLIPALHAVRLNIPDAIAYE